MPLAGTLRSWNDDRGFGFIAPTHGGAEIFVHVSAFPRDGSRPTVGESLTYELGRGKDGKPQAVKAWRNAIAREAPPSVKTAPPVRRQSSSASRLIAILLLVTLGVFAYDRYEKQLSAINAAPLAPVRHAAPVAGAESPSPQFSCDGRVYCSQMTSCREAKFFLRNCPGTRMDGNNDGVPCEQQWCTSPFAK